MRARRHWSLRIAGWLLGLFFLAVIGAVATFFIGYRMTDIPDPNRDFQANTTVVYYSDGRTPIGSFYRQNRLSVPLKDIPRHVQDAVFAAEDRTFWTNPGISASGIARASWRTARGKPMEGGSTITQQYVKILYLTQERTWSRKFKELFIATKLSRSRDKESILEGYLNTIYFGEGAYGVGAASKTYFGQDDVRKLTVPQAAYLATVLNNPRLFGPGPAARDRTLQRYRYVLDGMRQLGTITDQQYAAYSKSLPRITYQKRNRYAGPQGFLLDMVRRELLASGVPEETIERGGLRVTTTFDVALQKKAIEVVQGKQPRSTSNHPLQIGLASVRSGTGEVVALYGGPDFVKSQLNWATLPAHTAATFKPVIEAAEQQGGDAIALARQLGITTVRRGAGGIPNAEASPLDMANAYATLAASGKHTEWFTVKEIRTADGKLIRSTRPRTSNPIAPEVAARVDAFGRAGTAGGVAIEHLPRYRACVRKYGTVSAKKCGANADTLASWYVGHTDQFATAVLYRAGRTGVGDLDPFSSRKAFEGGDWPATTWMTFMYPAYAMTPSPFSR